MRSPVRLVASGDVDRRNNGRVVAAETSYEVPEGRTMRLQRVTLGCEHTVNEARVEVLIVDGEDEAIVAVGYVGTVQLQVDSEATAGQIVMIRRVNGDPTELHMTGIVEGTLL